MDAQDAGRPAGVRIKVQPNGPLLVEGPCVVQTAAGEHRREGPRTALCRCGQSANKPFCDSSHARVGFEAT